jgi:hypothetical protein
MSENPVEVQQIKFTRDMRTSAYRNLGSVLNFMLALEWQRSQGFFRFH